MKNPSLLAELPNAEEEELKILEEEGLSECDDPPNVVFEGAINKYKGDQMFVGELMKMEKEYKMILNRLPTNISNTMSLH